MRSIIKDIFNVFDLDTCHKCLYIHYKIVESFNSLTIYSLEKAKCKYHYLTWTKMKYYHAALAYKQNIKKNTDIQGKLNKETFMKL